MKNTEILKTFFINFLKWLISFVHLFSRTYFIFIFIILSIIALFYENSENYLVRLCQFFVFFLTLSSILLFITLNIEQSFSILSDLVGSTYLNKCFPLSRNRIRAFLPVTVFVSTICVFLVVDYYSLMWLDTLDYQDVEKMQEKMRSLYSDGKLLEGEKQADLTVERTTEILKNKGILTQLINNNKVVTFIEFFGKR